MNRPHYHTRKLRKGSNHQIKKVIDHETASNKTLASLCNLSVGQVSDFREIFRQIDLDNNGSIDENELQQLLQSIHGDEDMCSPEFVRSLIARVKSVQLSSNIKVDEWEKLEFTFEELMLSILKRPEVDYTKEDVLKAFEVLAGASESHRGVINTQKLARAIRYGNGGISKDDAEELMTMLEHTPTATFDYVELCDLLMGHKGNNTFEHGDAGGERDIMLERARKVHQHCQGASFMIPKHILDMNMKVRSGNTSTTNSSGNSTPAKGKIKGNFVGSSGRVHTKKFKKSRAKQRLSDDKSIPSPTKTQQNKLPMLPPL